MSPRWLVRGSLTALAAAAVLAAAPPGARTQDVPIAFIKVAELNARLKQREPIQIVDVRSRQEYLARHLPGAISVPLDAIEARAGEVRRDRLVVLY